MKKHKIIALTLCGLLFLLGIVNAQNINFIASATSPVSVGEPFTLRFKLNANGSNFVPPKLSGFHVLSGPMRSSSSSTQIINGKVSQNTSITYSYTLQAKKVGDITIPAASITANGKQVKSNPLPLKVVKGTPHNQQGNNRGNANSAVNYNNAAFLRTEVSKSNPMLGEQVIITYKLFFKVNIVDYAITTLPKYQGSWSEKLMDNNTPTQQYKQMVDGVQYHVAEIYREAIFPQKTGKMKASPMEFDVVMRVKDNSRRRSNDPFDDFFGNSFFNSKDIKKRLVSNTPNINVQSLPSKGKSANFSGSVGRFSISSKCNKTEVKVNDAITLTYTIKGSGNIKLAELPEIQFPADFETYDPEIRDHIQKSLSNGISGSKTFKYTCIPRTAGSFTIPALSFSYYDTSSKKYKTLTTKSYTIQVEKGENNGNVAFSANGNIKKGIQYVGEDIRYIKTHVTDLTKDKTPFFGSLSFFLWLIIPLVLFLLFVFWMNVSAKNKANIIGIREKKANKVAKKKLKIAHQYLNSNDVTSFYDALAQAMWGYIADKFNIPQSELSIHNVKSKLGEKQVNQSHIDTFVSTIEACDYARFAPGDKQEKMKDIYNKASDIIIQTEKELR